MIVFVYLNPEFYFGLKSSQIYIFGVHFWEARLRYVFKARQSSPEEQLEIERLVAQNYVAIEFFFVIPRNPFISIFQLENMGLLSYR